MSYYTKDIELKLIEYSNTEAINQWFAYFRITLDVDVKDILVDRALLYAKSKECFFDPKHKNDMATKNPIRYFSIIFKNHIMGDVIMLRKYIEDPTSMREPSQVAFYEKILKQSNRGSKLDQLVSD